MPLQTGTRLNKYRGIKECWVVWIKSLICWVFSSNFALQVCLYCAAVVVNVCTDVQMQGVFCGNCCVCSHLLLTSVGTEGAEPFAVLSLGKYSVYSSERAGELRNTCRNCCAETEYENAEDACSEA